MTESADNIVLAKFSGARVSLVLLVVIGMFMWALENPDPIAASRFQLHHRYPIFRWALVAIAGGGAFVISATLLRIIFIDRTAVSLNHGQLRCAWAFGTMNIDFRQISSLSHWKFPGVVGVETSDGKSVYIASGLTTTSSKALLDRLEDERARRSAKNNAP